MEINYAPITLDSFDTMGCEALVAPLYEDQRPPKAVAGLVDWRMCGMLSKLVMRGRVTGSEGELLLVPPRPRMPFDKIFVYGAGSAGCASRASFTSLVGFMLNTLAAAHVRTCAFSFPRGDAESLSAEVAAEELSRLLRGRVELDELIILWDGPDQKPFATRLEAELRLRARETMA